MFLYVGPQRCEYRQACGAYGWELPELALSRFGVERRLAKLHLILRRTTVHKYTCLIEVYPSKRLQTFSKPNSHTAVLIELLEPSQAWKVWRSVANVACELCASLHPSLARCKPPIYISRQYEPGFCWFSFLSFFTSVWVLSTPSCEETTY